MDEADDGSMREGTRQRRANRRPLRLFVTRASANLPSVHARLDAQQAIDWEST